MSDYFCMRYRQAKRDAVRSEHNALLREAVHLESFAEDTAYNLGRLASILQAICRRMRCMKTGGFLWCPGVERALEVAVGDARALMDVLRRFDVPNYMKVAALRHAFHGDWDLDTGTGYNGSAPRTSRRSWSGSRSSVLTAGCPHQRPCQGRAGRLHGRAQPAPPSG